MGGRGRRLDTVDRILVGNDPAFHPVIKPHPRQVDAGEELRVPERHGRATASVLVEDRLLLLHAADVVLGFQSMMPYEAQALEKPTIGLRFGCLDDRDTRNGPPGIEVVSDPADLETTPRRALVAAARTEPGRLPVRGNTSATERFLRAVGID